MQRIPFLVCHGSRDPRYQQAFANLVSACRAALHPLPVHAGQLEFGSGSLSDQLLALGSDHPLLLIPLFMGGGIHVEHDLPEAIAQAHRIRPDWQISLTQPIGQLPEVRQLLRHRIRASESTSDAWIVIGHGSRSPEFAAQMKNLIEALALPDDRIRAAFWSQSPQLAEQVKDLVELGHRRIRVVPFFLFPGAILDGINALAQSIELPGVEISVADPLVGAGSEPDAAQLIVQLMD